MLLICTSTRSLGTSVDHLFADFDIDLLNPGRESVCEAKKGTRKTNHMANAATVSEALQALFFSSDIQGRRTANDWLQNYQESPQAWQISVELLTSETCSPEHRLFSAQTLHAKAMRVDEDQLSEEELAGLQSQLVQLTRQYALAANRKIVTQLALTSAILVLRRPSYWHPLGLTSNGQESAQLQPHTIIQLQQQGLDVTAIATLLNALRPSGAVDQAAMNDAALEVLTVIPERCQHKQVRLYTRWREQLLQALCVCLPSTLGVLESMVASAPGATQDVSAMAEEQQIKHYQLLAAVFECLHSWLSIDHCVDDSLMVLFADRLAASPILGLAFQILKKPLVFLEIMRCQLRHILTTFHFGAPVMPLFVHPHAFPPSAQIPSLSLSLSCLTCTSASPTSCTSCTSGLLRYDGQCLKSCSEIQTPVYQVPQDQDDNEHDGSCHDCHPSCGSCNTGSASSCITCPSTSFAEKVG